jgi:hypothetical protein
VLTQVVVGVDFDGPGLDEPHVKVLVDFEGQTFFLGV